MSEQRLEFFQGDPNDFLSWLVTMDETWLYHYGLETKQQSMEWRHSGSPCLKNSECKICWKSFRPNFLGSRWHPPHWLSSKEPNYQRRVLLISVGVTEGLLKEKRRGKITKGDLFLHHYIPAHRALATQNKQAYLGFQYLHHALFSPDLTPSDYHLSLDRKNNWKVPIFRPMRRSLLPRGPGWTDNLNFSFLSGLQKLEQRAKKSIELRGEYVQ